MVRSLSLASAVASALALAGCSSDDPSRSASPTPSPSAAETPAATRTPTATREGDSVEGTVVRFSGGSTSVDVTISDDNVATRDLISMLPLTLRLEEFSGKEKISSLPRKLDVDGAPGHDPEDGDLIYFVPWGNLGFYYKADGIDFSDATVPIGSYKAPEEQLRRLENVDVTVEVVD